MHDAFKSFVTHLCAIFLFVFVFLTSLSVCLLFYFPAICSQGYSDLPGMRIWFIVFPSRNTDIHFYFKVIAPLSRIYKLGKLRSGYNFKGNNL